jgi:hypothetical protein
MYRAVLLAAAVAAGSVNMAQAAEVCLRPIRILTWAAVDTRTLIVVDRDKQHFLVRLTGACAGLTNPGNPIIIRSASELGCVRRGDTVSYVDPALGTDRCPIQEVVPYTAPVMPTEAR